MWAMLLSLAVTVPLMIFFFFCTAVLIAVIAFCTYRNRMNVLWWVIATVVMNFFVLIPYVIIRARISLQRCSDCGTIVNRNHRNVCPNCYARVKKINDKKFIQISILAYFIITFAWGMFQEIAPIFFS